MKYKQSIVREDTINLIQEKRNVLRGSAVIADQIKADALDEILEELKKQPLADAWIGPELTPEKETAVLIRAECDTNDKNQKWKKAYLGTYNEFPDGRKVWRTGAGQDLTKIITGWQYLPDP